MTTDVQARARCLGVVALGAAAPVMVVWVRAATDRSTLPDRLAVHFTAGGQANGYLSPGVLFATTLVITAAAAAMTIVPVLTATRRRQGQRGLVGTGAGIAWLMAQLYLVTLRRNAGHADPTTVRMGVWTVLVPLLVGVVVAVLATRLVPTPAPDPGDTTRRAADLPRRRMRRGERAVLTTDVGSVGPVVWLVSVGVVVLGVVLLLRGDSLAGGLVPIAIGVLVLAATFGLSLQVDRGGVKVRLLGLPWPVARARMARIESAESVDLHPSEWGGWGYRITPHGRAVILRSGPGLVVHLADGHVLAVSTDDADEAAALVNGLVTQPGRAG